MKQYTAPSRRRVLKKGSVAIVGAMGLAGCTGSDNGDSGSDNGDSGSDNGGIDITLATTYEPDHINTVAANRWAKRVAEETDGDITMSISPGGAYGAVDEIHDLLRDGALEATVSGGLPWFRYAPEYAFIEIPFLMPNYEQQNKIVHSDEFEPGREKLREEGKQRLMGNIIYRGSRHFTANKPVREPADLEGIDLRLPENEAWVNIWEAIGGEHGLNINPVALDELYNGLQSGVVNASEGDIEQIRSFSLFEVQDYLCLTGHHPQPGIMYLSDEFYQNLDQTYQEVLDETADEVTAAATEEIQETEPELIQETADQGMELIEDVDREAFRERGAPAANKMFEDRFAKNWDHWLNI